MLAAVRVRGQVDVRRSTRHTLENLGITKRNQLVLLEDNDATKGMLSKTKDYITFGEISEETVEKLEEKTGRDLESGDKVSLTPPSGGFKNTRKQVGQGGSLGKRDDMDDLIQRMV